MFLATSRNFNRKTSASTKIRNVAAIILLVMTSANSRAQTSQFGLPSTFDPLMHGQKNAELKQLASQLYDDTSFGRLSAGEKETLNSELDAALKTKGRALVEASPTDAEADYQMALVFMLNLERIGKVSPITGNERNAIMLKAHLDGIKEYLTKYLTRAPNGRYATRARELLNAMSGSK